MANLAQLRSTRIGRDSHDRSIEQAWTSSMLAYLTIFATTITGLAGGPPWVIAATAIVLSSLSLVRYGNLYAEGRRVGLTALLDSTFLRSLGNAVVAAGSAYGFGWLLRLI